MGNSTLRSVTGRHAAMSPCHPIVQCVRVRMSACVCVCVPASACMCLHACMRACVCLRGPFTADSGPAPNPPPSPLQCVPLHASTTPAHGTATAATSSAWGGAGSRTRRWRAWHAGLCSTRAGVWSAVPPATCCSEGGAAFLRPSAIGCTNSASRTRAPTARSTLSTRGRACPSARQDTPSSTPPCE